MKKYSHLFLLLAVIAVLLWSAIKPASYRTWMLEASPAIVGILVVAAVYKRFRFTTLSYWIMALLAVSMLIGAHYVYSNVPLFDRLKDVFHWERNHYDRLGHFLKGAMAIVVREILIRATALSSGLWVAAIASGMTLAIAALYEIIEWLAAVIMKKGKTIHDFLGTQGDPWDTQWDMLLCLIGSAAALLMLSKLHDRQLQRVNPQ